MHSAIFILFRGWCTGSDCICMLLLLLVSVVTVTTTLALVLLYAFMAGFFAVLLIVANKIRHSGDSVRFSSLSHD